MRVSVNFYQVRFGPKMPPPPRLHPAGPDLQTRRTVERPAETCSHRQVMEPHQLGATGQTGPEGAAGVYYRKNTFLLVFCASATPASGKLKELQLDIWEVLMLPLRLLRRMEQMK